MNYLNMENIKLTSLSIIRCPIPNEESVTAFSDKN